jgi:hypothetical protein
MAGKGSLTKPLAASSQVLGPVMHRSKSSALASSQAMASTLQNIRARLAGTGAEVRHVGLLSKEEFDAIKREALGASDTNRETVARREANERDEIEQRHRETEGPYGKAYAAQAGRGAKHRKRVRI